MADRTKWFVSTAWLADHIEDPNIALIDASWHLPNSGRDAHSEELCWKLGDDGLKKAAYRGG